MRRRGRVFLAQSAAQRAGFTLLEILAALAVLGVATGIFASLFAASINLGHLNQSQAVAATLAEAQLVLLRDHPQGFVWPDFSALEDGAFARVLQQDASQTALSATTLPAMMPIDRRAYDRDRNFYERYSWQCLGRLPAPDAGYVELVVVIEWEEKGKPQRFTLTSAIPRNQVEAAR